MSGNLIERGRIIRIEGRCFEKGQSCIRRLGGKAVGQGHQGVAVRTPRLQTDGLAKFPQRVIQAMPIHVDRPQCDVHLRASG